MTLRVNRDAQPELQVRRGTDRLAELLTASPMFDAVIEEIDGRRIRIGQHWLSDFASCNYLGFDLDPQIIDSVDQAIRRWGTHPSWSRMLGNPRLYPDIEDRLTELLGAPDVLVLPTITHIHLTVLPVLAAGGWIFVDGQAHRTVYDGAKAATAAGATLRRYPANDLGELERLLRSAPPRVPKVICTDGVNSMTGNVCDLAALAALAREHDGLLYVDDAHGFGVLGERSPDELCAYGSRGNSVVRHLGESYDNVVLVGGFSKAYSSLLAFLALPTALKERLKVAASPYLYSGPSPTASLATVLAGFEVNADRGDRLRADLHRKTARVLDTLHRLDLHSRNTSGLPIIEIPLQNADDLPAVGQFLFDQGIYVTLASYPLVPMSEVGFRVQLTTANTEAEIDQLATTLALLAERFALPGAGLAAMTGPARKIVRNADADWDSWPVQQYLDEIYAELHPVDAAVIDHHSAYYARLTPDSLARSLEFGAGPNLYPLLLAAACSRQIEAVDPGSANVAYLKQQLTDGPDERWEPFYDRCRQGNPALPASARAALSRVQVRQGDGLGIRPGQYDLASMHFVAESVTESPTEFVGLCRAFIRSVRPGGHLVAAFMEGMPSYRLGTGPQWPGFPVDADQVREVFVPLTDELVVQRIDNDPSLPDYGDTGMILLTARRPDRAH